jgi:hypothetical protein
MVWSLSASARWPWWSALPHRELQPLTVGRPGLVCQRLQVPVLRAPGDLVEYWARPVASHPTARLTRSLVTLDLRQVTQILDIPAQAAKGGWGAGSGR